jgi:hypothetical protein
MLFEKSDDDAFSATVTRLEDVVMLVLKTHRIYLSSCSPR